MSSSVTSRGETPPPATPVDVPFLSRFTGVFARGLLAGVVGATALAAWFLVIDGSQGAPLRTPAFLANSLLGVEGIIMGGFGPIALYTLIHYGGFIVVGLVVSWLLTLVETASPVLLGLVLGFALFDIVFYGSVIVTGVNVVELLGWPEVLAGNLIAGVCLMGVMHLTGATRPVTWWETLAANQVVREGVVAGLLGAVVVAAWFLIFDLARGNPLFTPAALGSTLFLGAASVDEVVVSGLTVLGYSILHLGAFILTGFLVAGIAAAADDQPPLVLAAVLLFAVFEAFFMGSLAMVAEFLLGALAWWTIAVGNLLAALSMGWYLWMNHPKLRAALQNDPLDRTD
jgi:hypothetical protein